MDEIYCDDCGAYFRNDCHCDGLEENVRPEPFEVWRGMDGHLYEGNSNRASLAWHRDDCGCPGSTNFDPDAWY